jgi:hypothetical protein
MAIASEKNFQDWEAALAEGLTPFEASRKAGTTLSALKRGDRVRHDEGVESALEAREGYVLETLKSNVDRAMQAEPVYDSDGEPTGEYTYQGGVANKGLELLGKTTGMFVDKRELEITAKVEHEHRGVFAVAELVKLADELQVLDQLGLVADRPEGAVPAAKEIPARSAGAS